MTIYEHFKSMDKENTILFIVDLLSSAFEEMGIKIDEEELYYYTTEFFDSPYVKPSEYMS